MVECLGAIFCRLSLQLCSFIFKSLKIHYILFPYWNPLFNKLLFLHTVLQSKMSRVYIFLIIEKAKQNFFNLNCIFKMGNDLVLVYHIT